MPGSYVLGLAKETKLWMFYPMIIFLVVGTISKVITYRVLKKEKDRPVNILIWFNQVRPFNLIVHVIESMVSYCMHCHLKCLSQT